MGAIDISQIGIQTQIIEQGVACCFPNLRLMYQGYMQAARSEKNEVHPRATHNHCQTMSDHVRPLLF